jgi:hypothetical protein
MWQEIIITDVTRMRNDRVCLAGVDRKGKCIRPLLPYPEFLREHHLYDIDSVVIRPRAVVNLFLEPDPDPELPHSEDYFWKNQNQMEFLRQPDEKVWHMVLQRTASESVASMFGALIRKNKYVAPGDGVCSLGTLKPASLDKLGYYQLEFNGVKTDKFTLNFTDSTGEVFKQIPITDLSLRYYVKHLQHSMDYGPRRIRAYLERQFAQSKVWLRLGLTRPFQKSDSDRKWCYIQVTGVYTFPDYLDGRCFADFMPSQPISAAQNMMPELYSDVREGRDDRRPEYRELPEEW